MQPQFIHNVNASFLYWFEHELLSKGGCYTNYSGELYAVKDNRFAQSGIYSSPYGSFVYDSSIIGARLPSGVYIDNTFVDRQSGLTIDYNNGRVLLPPNLHGSKVTIDSAIKNYNVYPTDLPEEKLIFEERVSFKPQVNYPVSGLPAGTYIAPCVFVKYYHMDNQPYAFGGMDESSIYIRAIIFDKDQYGLDGVGNIFCDAQYKSFMLLDSYPFNYFGDFVSGNSYDYLSAVQQSYDKTKMVFIESVDFTRFNASPETQIARSASLGFLEFKLTLPRYPRV